MGCDIEGPFWKIQYTCSINVFITICVFRQVKCSKQSVQSQEGIYFSHSFFCKLSCMVHWYIPDRTSVKCYVISGHFLVSFGTDSSHVSQILSFEKNWHWPIYYPIYSLITALLPDAMRDYSTKITVAQRPAPPVAFPNVFL